MNKIEIFLNQLVEYDTINKYLKSLLNFIIIIKILNYLFIDKYIYIFFFFLIIFHDNLNLVFDSIFLLYFDKIIK